MPNKNTTHFAVTALMCFLLAFFAGSLAAAVTQIGPGNDLPDAVNAMNPGDTLELASGTYSLTTRFSIGLNCSSSLPCVIRASAGASPHVTRAGDAQNIVDIESSHYLTIQGIEFSGGSAGLRLRESTFITLTGNHIHDTADVAIRANDSGYEYEGLRIRRNHIENTDGTGEAIFLGCNNDACRVSNSLIENNYIHNTNHTSAGFGEGIDLKEGSSGNIIRDNVIHDTKGACISVFSTVGNGSINMIERNLMWGCTNQGILSVAEAVIRNNIVFVIGADGITSTPLQNDEPKNLTVSHNTVLSQNGSALRLVSPANSVTATNNALYSQNGAALRGVSLVSTPTVTGNVGSGQLVGFAGGFDGSGNVATDFVAASYSGALPQNLFPSGGSKLIGAANVSWLAAEDFNRTQRENSSDTGAYRFDAAGNPGQPLTAGFKKFEGIFSDGFEAVDSP